MRVLSSKGISWCRLRGRITSRGAPGIGTLASGGLNTNMGLTDEQGISSFNNSLSTHVFCLLRDCVVMTGTWS